MTAPRTILWLVNYRNSTHFDFTAILVNICNPEMKQHTGTSLLIPYRVIEVRMQDYPSLANSGLVRVIPMFGWLEGKAKPSAVEAHRPVYVGDLN